MWLTPTSFRLGNSDGVSSDGEVAAIIKGGEQLSRVRLQERVGDVAINAHRIPLRVFTDAELTQQLADSNRHQVSQAPYFVAGQSPLSLAYSHTDEANPFANQSKHVLEPWQNLVLQGIITGRGLLQFVSPRTNGLTKKLEATDVAELHKYTNNTSVINKLVKEIRYAPNKTLILGDYQISCNEPVQELYSDALYLELTVKKDSEPPHTVRITQLGMPFSDKSLSAANIALAA
jgi:hypothetical protein